MTYHEQELLVSQSPQKRTFNESNKYLFPTRLSSSQSLRIECKAEERYFIDQTSPYKINSPLKPIQYTMTEENQPLKFRSEIIVHNDPEINLHIKRFRVNFYYPDDLSENITTTRSQSLHIPNASVSQKQKENNSKRRYQPAILSPPQTVLHQWIDDICANEQLMSNDDIVFFIKNGEFFARI